MTLLKKSNYQEPPQRPAMEGRHYTSPWSWNPAGWNPIPNTGTEIGSQNPRTACRRERWQTLPSIVFPYSEFQDTKPFLFLAKLIYQFPW